MTSPPLASGSPRKRKRFARPNGKLIAGGVALLLALVGVWFFFLRAGGDADPYRTEAVQTGDITSSVAASGTLEALVTVEVGSQISGQVTQVMADYNDRVRRGQVLAVLDPQNQQSAVEQSRAAIQAAQASVATAEANVALAQAEYDRQKFLFDRGIIAQAALDTADASLKTAQAGVRQARAQVAQQQAQLRANQATLGRTTIVAPIDGIVIDRQVEPGQTVASGLNVAVLFTLAQDLSRVQALISVDEADIGQVKPGQTVRFTVDAFPNDTFAGTVTRIRALPQSESSVVAYTVEVEAENPGERLLPGMTANADIVLTEQRGVLRVPNSALRFTPAGASAQGAQGGGQRPQGQGGGQGQRGQGGGRAAMAATIIGELSLDAAQRTQIEPILQRAQETARAQMRAAGGRGGQGARRSGGGAAMAGAFSAAFDEIQPLLRPDQQAKLAELRSRFASSGGGQGVVWVLRDGQPVSVRVRTGATDGSYTEILGGELRAGDQVITGGGPRRTDERAQQAAQRMGGGGGFGRR